MSERVGASDKRQGWHWSDYWRNGRAEVMTIDSAAGAAPLDTAAFWRANLHGIVTGERVLDLATGSGQVAGYAAQVAAECGETAEVIGVDYADIAANARPLPTGVTLKGGVALEALPFEAAQFDVATSQFGIEYADHRAALAELARVCRPGARVFLLLHHADSAITRHSRRQIAAYDGVLGSGGAIRQARRAFTAHLKAAPAPTRAAAEQAFREAVARATGRLEPEPGFDVPRYLVGYLADLAARIAAYDPSSSLARLDAFERGNSAWRQRQLCQTRAALDCAGMDGFLKRASAVSLETSHQAEHHDADGALIGWRVGLRRV